MKPPIVMEKRFRYENGGSPLSRIIVSLLIYLFVAGACLLLAFLLEVPLFEIFKNTSASFLVLFFLVLACLAPIACLRYQQGHGYKRLAALKEQFNTLKMITQGSLEIEGLDHLLKLIPRFLMHMYLTKMHTRIAHASVFFYDAVTKSYILVAHRGRQEPTTSYLALDDPIVTWFTKEAPYLVQKRYLIAADSEALRYEDIDYFLKLTSLAHHEPKIARSLKKLKEELSCLKASICIPCFYQGECNGFLILGEKIKGSYFKEEVDTLATVSHYIAMAIRSAKLHEEVVSSYLEAIQGVAKSLEARDQYTKGHSERVVWYGLAIASELIDIPPYNQIVNFLEKVQQAALLHDVGKIGIRDDILLKPERLTPEEKELIAQHPKISEHILRGLKGISEDVLLGIKYHHERSDGKGYYGVAGENIPPIARILAVADSYDAMTTDRPYRQALTDREAVKEIIKNTDYLGPQWDQFVVEALLRACKKGRLKENVVFSDADLEEIRQEIEAEGLRQKTGGRV